MLIDKRPTQLDRIITHLKTKKRPDQDEAPLSAKDEELLNRFIQLRTLELRYTKTDAIAVYEKLFNLSTSQGYRDHVRMQSVFGNVERTNKDFKREMQLLKLDRLAQEAREAGDLKTAAAIEMKVFDWTTKEDENPPFDPDDINPPIYIIGQFPEQFRNNGLPKDKQGLQKLLEDLKRPKNLAHVEEIEFTETKDGE